MLFVGSTPFSPAGWSGKIEVESIGLDEVKKLVTAAQAVTSFCGHPGSASFMGVPMSRDAAPAPTPGETQEWVGIRPLRRAKPGEELLPEETPEAFVGCHWWLTTT